MPDIVQLDGAADFTPPRELLERLLDLYPRAALLTAWEMERVKKGPAIDQIVGAAPMTDIFRFAAENGGRTRQHVHLVEAPPNHQLLSPSVLGHPPLFSSTNGDETAFSYIVPLNFKVVLDGPLEHSTLSFLWPMKLVLAPNHARLHLTIMSKNVDSYYPGRVVVRARPSLQEQDFLGALPAAIEAPNIVPLDINRGVKALWEADRIDSPKIKWKKAKSVTEQVMDEQYRVKQDDPDVYVDAQAKPLLATLFEFRAGDAIVDYFKVDPTYGRVFFRRFSRESSSVDNVVREILAAN